MKFAILAIALVSCASVAVAKEHPIAKVIGLLEGIATTVENEGKAEQVAFTKFTYWCKGSTKDLNAAIDEEKETVGELEDTIEAKTKLSESLDKDIKALRKKISKQTASQTTATGIRDEERGNFEDADRYFKSTITAIKGAVTALSNAGETTESLVQVSKAVALLETSATTEQLDTLHAFVAQAGPSGSGSAAGHVDKYKFKSGNVIELLKSLQAKFEDDLLEATKAETNAANAYKLAKKALDNAKTAAEKSRDEKLGFKSDADNKKAQAVSDLAGQNRDLTADSKTLSDTEADCAKKTGEWNHRQAIRASELEAIDTACKILAKASNVRSEKNTNEDMHVRGEFFFLQISDPKMKAVELIRESAKKTKSKTLERFAQQLSVNLNGPFDAVNNMIEKMIFRLQAEQKDEDDHKNWCDAEVEKTRAMIRDKTDKSATLKVKIDAGKASVQSLAEDIVDADTMVAKLTKHMADSTEIRETSKEENSISIKDAQQAQTAIASAVAVLTDFFKENGMVAKKAYEFVQGPAELEAPPASATKVGDNSAILNILEITASNFARMEADTKAQESSEEDSFKTDIKDCTIELSKRSTESKMKNEEKTMTQNKVDTMTKSRKNVEGELEATNQYYTDLHPACLDGDSSYDDRKAARATEIEALHQAQGILTDAFKGASFLQKRK